MSEAGAAIPIDETGISWGEDRRQKFAELPSLFFNTDPALRGGGMITGNMRAAEHFIVWMRPATLPNFRKLWGRIRVDISEGTRLNVTVNNRCDPLLVGTNYSERRVR